MLYDLKVSVTIKITLSVVLSPVYKKDQTPGMWLG
jgi:hypothetical protein